MFFAPQAEAFYLLSVRDFSQSAGLSYRFARSVTSSSPEETEHEFVEDYAVNFRYSLLGPQFLRGSALLDLAWDQLSTDTGVTIQRDSNFQLHYNINGQLLAVKPCPITFSALSSRQTVSQSFAPSYDSTTSDLTAKLSILNKHIPANISVDHLSMETSGAAQNFTQTSDTLSASATPDLGKFGALNLGAVWTDGNSTAQNTGVSTTNSSASFSAGYQNSWKSDRGLLRSLSLTYADQETAGTTPFTNQNLNGNLSWQLGKALDTTLTYQRGSTSSPQFATENQGGSVTLTHRLFESLTTGLNLSAADTTFNGGANDVYSGGASLHYHKLLPKSSDFDFGYSFNESLNERTGDVSVIAVVNEQHPIPTTIPRLITLAHPTFDPASIRVTGAQTLLPYPSSYFTAAPGGIELTNFIAGDTAVLISYNYRQDPNVTTSAVSHGINTSVNLFQGKYRLYADAFLTDQNLVKGTATSLTLTSTRHYDTGATAHLNRHTLNAEAGYDKSYAQNLYYLSSSWLYSAPFARGDLTLSALDRYSWESLSQGTAQTNLWMNSFNLRSGYIRTIGAFTSRIQADYANVLVQGGQVTHTALISINIEARFGKLFALLTSTSTWNFSNNGNSSSSQGVGISVRRVF